MLGLLLGLERIYAHKTVGLRTYALASAATCFFVSISLYIGLNLTHIGDGFNPAFIAGSVITGIGIVIWLMVELGELPQRKEKECRVSLMILFFL
jgi:uncharacterized membrane protein YhiD involved in acid resistance